MRCAGDPLVRGDHLCAVIISCAVIMPCATPPLPPHFHSTKLVVRVHAQLASFTDTLRGLEVTCLVLVHMQLVQDGSTARDGCMRRWWWMHMCSLVAITEQEAADADADADGLEPELRLVASTAHCPASARDDVASPCTCAAGGSAARPRRAGAHARARVRWMPSREETLPFAALQ